MQMMKNPQRFTMWLNRNDDRNLVHLFLQPKRDNAIIKPAVHDPFFFNTFRSQDIK